MTRSFYMPSDTLARIQMLQNTHAAIATRQAYSLVDDTVDRDSPVSPHSSDTPADDCHRQE